MTRDEMKKIFEDTDFVHRSGTREEQKVARYLQKKCGEIGVDAAIESFPVEMAQMKEAHVSADGQEIPCKGMFCCGSGEIEAELYYMPGQDPVSIAGAKDKIVLMDTTGIGYYTYQDLVKAGAKGILFQYGNVHYDNDDIDEKDLRKATVRNAEKLLCAMIHTRDAVRLVERGVKKIRLKIRQEEYMGKSHNVVAEIPGKRKEWIMLSAHYDTTSMSHGAYDNMSGCVGLLSVMQQLSQKELNYGVRFLFCGSEERGLLGSKAYVRMHKEELTDCVLNINLDMIGSTMGKFIACASAEEALAGYLNYMGAEIGFPIEAKTGVYSSDSTSFADAGVPAVSLARITNLNVGHIHCRYDKMDIVSMEQLTRDIEYIRLFTERMASAAVCPVAREIPDKIKGKVDEYLARKRKHR